MQILPKLRTEYGDSIGVELYIAPPNLAENPNTFLSTDVASGVSSLSVDSGTKLSIGQYALLGAWGSEKSEIVRVHASTPPTATTVTLASATAFAHNRGERLTFIPYNQIIIERSTDAGANYSTLATVDIRANSTETYYNDTDGTSAYLYRVKFSNSATSGVSATGEGIVGLGFADNSVGAILRSALVGIGEREDSVITKEFLLDALHEGRAELNKMSGAEKWSFRTSFDYDAGNVVPGHNELALPSTLREADTFKNVLSVRIGRDKLPLNKVDKHSLNRWYQGVARTTLNGAITTGSTSIVLTSSGDFDESGDIVIAAAAVDEVLDTVSYTSNTESTNTLAGATGIRAAGHASGAIAWQSASFGYPTEYSIFENKIVFSQPFADDYAGENIWLDFYTELVRADSEADLLDEPHYEMFIPYLRYRIKKRRDKTLVAKDDDDFKSWEAKRDAAVDKEFTGQDIRLVIDVPC
jgi:hypothetical protein